MSHTFRIVRPDAPITLGEWVAAAGQAKGLRLHAESSVTDGPAGEAIVVKQIRGDLDVLMPNTLWRKLRGKPRVWVDGFDFDSGAGNARFKLRARKFRRKSRDPLVVAAVRMATLLNAAITDSNDKIVFAQS